ncbi:Alpha/Beta hydrolase protein [Trametes elegans]|nr:Alpha/Beta hydrolase protein [Trametes elegans]
MYCYPMAVGDPICATPSIARHQWTESSRQRWPRPPTLAGTQTPPTFNEIRRVSDSYFGDSFIAHHRSLLPPESSYTVEDYLVLVKDGDISVRVIVPTAGDDANATFPVLVFYHGGGWTFGTVDMDDFFLRRLAVDLGLSVVNVDYRLAPEHVFPTAVEDCIAALKWTVENTAVLKADLGKGFVVGGDSAGGNLTAIVTHEARDDRFFEGRRPTGQLLRELFVAHPAAYPEHLKSQLRSVTENKDMQPLTSAALFDMFERYQPDPADPRFSPLLYPSHAGLPRAFIQAMELDPIRDDAIVYAQALRDAGVETRLEVYPGVSHGFHYPYPTIAAAGKVLEGSVRGLVWLLGRE